MTSPRSHRCLKGRMFTSIIAFVTISFIFILYQTNERSFQEIKSRQHRCLDEQASLVSRLRAEKEGKEQLEQSLAIEKQAMATLRAFQQNEKNLLKSRISTLQDQHDSLTIECNKIETSAKEEQILLDKYKTTLQESQSHMNSVIEESKREILSLQRQIKKLKQAEMSSKHSYFFSEGVKQKKNVSKQIEVSNGIYNVVVRPTNAQIKLPKVLSPNIITQNNDAHKLADESFSPDSAKPQSSHTNNSVASSNTLRHIVPNGFAPELLVNDEKHKATDINIIPKEGTKNVDINNNVPQSSNEQQKNQPGIAPNRYEAKLGLDLNNKVVGEHNNYVNKLDEALERLPPPLADKKQDFFHFQNDQDAFDKINKNNLFIENNNQRKDFEAKNLDNPDLNDVNLSMDQAEPALQNAPEEDDDENEDYDINKVNFPHHDKI